MNLPRMRPRSTVRLLLASAMAAAVMAAVPSSKADDWWPGIPNAVDVADAWYGSAVGGMGYSTKAAQWFRNPVGISVARAQATMQGSVGVPQVDSSGNPANVQRGEAVGEAYIVSPSGAPANYGYLAPATVRSVGFGLMPVEATIQVSQRRRNGYPIPIRAVLHGRWVARHLGEPYSEIISEPVVVDDALNVEVKAVKIDGRSVGLRPGCRTRTPAPIHLVGPGYIIDTPQDEPGWFASHDPTTFYSPFHGGYMEGTITIPPFTGCRTATGDDISALMTVSASGPGNPIKAVSSDPFECSDHMPHIDGQRWPFPPGASTPKKTGCAGPMTLPYPPRPSS
ncbi:hypothetical protein [Nocardioides sp.]|uniref:hypothetical protein n=1 Tax=Nocardioides sp. TaxID=35761 RepID=UPI0026360820|nr:hypothetical protein [Nocardioides sp.]